MEVRCSGMPTPMARHHARALAVAPLDVGDFVALAHARVDGLLDQHCSWRIRRHGSVSRTGRRALTELLGSSRWLSPRR